MCACNEMASTNCSGNDVCVICGDGNASRHYGVSACFGCKGFFRRSIKAGQKYICRFDSKCEINADKRNTCRFCRLERCLKMGMSVEAIRPDRDATGKQYRPRRRAIGKERKSMPQASSASDSGAMKRNRFAQRTLLMQLMSVENSINSGKVRAAAVNSYDQSKLMDKCTLSEVLEDPELLDWERTEMRYDVIRSASLNDFTASLRRSLIAAVDWVNGMGTHFGITSTNDKLALLKNCYVTLTVFNLAARTSQNTINPDAICLPFGCCIKRNVFSNPLLDNMVSRTLDDLIFPLNKMNLEEREIVALKAIIVLNPDAPGLSSTTARSVATHRDRVLLSLFQNVSDQFLTSGAVSRFGNILLLLPPISVTSSLITENLMMARLVFESDIDPMIFEILAHHQRENGFSHTASLERSMQLCSLDKESQTETFFYSDDEYYLNEQANSFLPPETNEEQNGYAESSRDSSPYCPSLLNQSMAPFIGLATLPCNSNFHQQ